MEDCYMTVKEVALFLNESEQWCRREGREHGIPWVKHGVKLKVLRSKLEEWAESRPVGQP
ncbi:helix-turn-helix domain-containing protein [Sphaerisporangium sp. NPDC088356]|uniref:helix-turn-helix domain-containing protein n=1 Tax=Sphaerisporangium sp. NPDC088356 TaxID=3154871 RepID=UPI003415F9D6